MFEEGVGPKNKEEIPLQLFEEGFMKYLILTLVILVTTAMPALAQEQPHPEKAECSSSEGICSDEQGEQSWEAKELQKYGLSKDSTVEDIINNPNKPKIDDIINWDQ